MKDKELQEKYDDVVDDSSSDVELICIEAYKGTYQVGPGQFKPYAYKVGDVLPRKQIFLIPDNWQLAK